MQSSTVPDAPDPSQAITAAPGGPPDAVIEAVGLPGAIDSAIRWAGMGGTVVSLGLCTTQDAFSPEAATMKEARLLPSTPEALRGSGPDCKVLVAPGFDGG